MFQPLPGMVCAQFASGTPSGSLGPNQTSVEPSGLVSRPLSKLLKVATGMPISIALGLTVLSFMFTLTDVRTESVALKLFTGIESFEIMAIPFFILAGNFLTHGGVARRMITFATAMVGHWYGGLALAAVLACALFAAISGSSPATVVAIGQGAPVPSAASVHALTATLRSVADAIETETPPRPPAPLPADPELDAVTASVRSVLSVLIKGGDGFAAAQGGAGAGAPT